MAAKLFDLDETIELNGRQTTIRQEHQGGRVRGMRGNNGPVTGQNPFGHWALIDGQPFSVSAVDHGLLRGEPIADK